jgi:uncharacterized protein (DUF1778 family)
MKTTETIARQKGNKVVRVNPRFPESTAKRLKEASALRGQSVAAFILEVVSREAERVLQEEKVWNLSAEAAEKIQRMLAKPPSINAAARKAAKDSILSCCRMITTERGSVAAVSLWSAICVKPQKAISPRG